MSFVFSAKDNVRFPKFRRNYFLAEPESNILPQKKIIASLWFCAVILLLQHVTPGLKKEKKTSVIPDV